MQANYSSKDARLKDEVTCITRRLALLDYSAAAPILF